MAVLSRQKQPSGQTSRFEPRIASSIVPRAISVSSKAGPMAVLSRLGPMAVVSCAISLSAAGPSHFIKAMSNGRFIKAWPFYQSRSSQVGQTSRFEPRIASSILARAISLSASESEPNGSAVLSRHKQLARHPDFGRGLQIPYYSNLSAAGPSYFQQKQVQQQFYKGKAQWQFYQGLGRFIKAEAAKWLDIQISVADCKVHIIPRNQFISGRAKLFSAKAGPMAVLSTRGPMAVLSKQKQPDGQTSRFQRQIAIWYYPAQSVYQRPGQAILSKSRPNGRFINARPNGRFIKAEATGWPDLQISATNCNFCIIPHNQFISGRAKLFSAKAGPMAVLSTRGPMAVLSKQKQPDGQTSRF